MEAIKRLCWTTEPYAAGSRCIDPLCRYRSTVWERPLPRCPECGRDTVEQTHLVASSKAAIKLLKRHGLLKDAA